MLMFFSRYVAGMTRVNCIFHGYVGSSFVRLYISAIGMATPMDIASGSLTSIPQFTKYFTGLFFRSPTCCIYYSSKENSIHKQLCSSQPERPEVGIIGNADHPPGAYCCYYYRC